MNNWDFNEKYNCYTLTQNFGNKKTFFELDEIDHNSFILNFYQNEQEKINNDKFRDEYIPIDGDKYHQAFLSGDIDYVKRVVEKTVEYFYSNLAIDPVFINENLKTVIENIELENSISENKQKQLYNFTNQIQISKITGYVQGVCECIAAIDNYDLGKKLLSEMQVTKDMAKKLANPETYKVLEEGIFAQKPDQKLEQTQGVRR